MTRAATDDGLEPIRHISSAKVVAVRGESLEYRDDRVVGESPLEIRAAGPGQAPVDVAVTMRTPGHEAELAIGFLRTEGLITGSEVLSTQAGDPADLSQPDDTILVRLAVPFDATAVAERHFIATASCGICGKASIDEVALRCDPIPPGPSVGRPVILALPDMLRAAQRAFDQTGGLHAAALFTPDGQLIAAVVGIPILCAVSAPSDLAVATAERLGVTLVGFLRGDGFNVYSHDGRIELRDLSGLG